MQLVAALIFIAFPGSHGAHVVHPILLLYDPVMQSLHSYVDLNFPAGQDKQPCAVAIFPAPQLWQSSLLSVGSSPP
jgi:hypothetical protein